MGIEDRKKLAERMMVHAPLTLADARFGLSSLNKMITPLGVPIHHVAAVLCELASCGYTEYWIWGAIRHTVVWGIQQFGSTSLLDTLQEIQKLSRVEIKESFGGRTERVLTAILSDGHESLARLQELSDRLEQI